MEVNIWWNLELGGRPKYAETGSAPERKGCAAREYLRRMHPAIFACFYGYVILKLEVGQWPNPSFWRFLALKNSQQCFGYWREV